VNREYQQLLLRVNNTTVPLSKELEMTVLRQETVMNGHLRVLDELHLSTSSLMEEIKIVDDKKLITLGEIVLNSVAKLKEFESSYVKSNSLLYSLCLSNKKRGDAILQLVPRLKALEGKLAEYEKKTAGLGINIGGLQGLADKMAPLEAEIKSGEGMEGLGPNNRK